MRRFSKNVTLGASLLGLSVLFYLLHYLIFRSWHHIFLYLIGDIAFVFIQVLLVTLGIHRIIEERDRKARVEKLNIVIGVFFSEVGTELLGTLSSLDPGVEKWQADRTGRKESLDEEHRSIDRFLEHHRCGINADMMDWTALRDLLVKKRELMLRLLENPSLLEHESFTDALRAVFHLVEELGYRQSFDNLPDTDLRHLDGDTNRAYGRLTRQWMLYMEHMRESYPYLYSLAMRTNPFNRHSSAIVWETR